MNELLRINALGCPPVLYEPPQSGRLPASSDRVQTYTVIDGRPYSVPIENNTYKQEPSRNNCEANSVMIPELPRLAPSQKHANFSHDAWRSVKQASDDRDAHLLYAELDRTTRQTADMSDCIALGSIASFFIGGYPEQPFDEVFIYGAMHSLYQLFLINKNWNESRYFNPATLINESVWNKVSSNDSTIDGYDATPEAFKETDRRIIMAAAAQLQDETLCMGSVIPNLNDVLADPAVQWAIADGQDILRAAASGVPYDRTNGFALNTAF